MLKTIALRSIRLYQGTISQVTPPACRFTPTCSQYGYEAIQKYGFFKGSWMTFLRICRCNPWTPRGYDPVP
ncbi:MAG: membrane protein insertion efficiency factor YidD [Dehalococcoidia bacterium]